MEQVPVHRKLIKHFHEPGHLHELTFSCFERIPLLTNDGWCERLARCLDQACIDERFELIAFVFMPEHVHLLVRPISTGATVSRFLARLKQPFSAEVRSLLSEKSARLLKQLTVQERPGKKSFRFWQAGPGYDRNIYSEKTLNASLDYIHCNPVNRGLRKTAIDWKWSSAKYYLDVVSRQQVPGFPHIHGLID